MVWIVEWSQPEQYDHKVTTFAIEADALSSACFDMMEEVMNWDLSDPDIEQVARRINDYVMVGDWRNAIREFNDDQSETGSEYAMYWHVYESQPIVGGKQPRTILFQDPSDEDEDEEDDEEEDEAPYQATTPGATCRGPCGQQNEYAYADKKDGTYCCYQCKMMSQVFGGAVP